MCKLLYTVKNEVEIHWTCVQKTMGAKIIIPWRLSGGANTITSHYNSFPTRCIEHIFI